MTARGLPDKSERSISPIEKVSRDESNDLIMLSNQKLRQSRNNKFCLRLHETSNNESRDCPFESVESIQMSEDFGNSSSVSLLAKFQHVEPSLRHMRSMQPVQIAPSSHTFKRTTVSGAKSNYSRISGITNREYSARDFKNTNKLIDLKNSLMALSLSIDKKHEEGARIGPLIRPLTRGHSSQANVNEQLNSSIRKHAAQHLQQTKSETKLHAHHSKLIGAHSKGFVG